MMLSMSALIPFVSMESNSIFIVSFNAIGAFLGRSACGCTFLSITSFILPGMEPILSKPWGYWLARSSTFLIGVALVIFFFLVYSTV